MNKTIDKWYTAGIFMIKERRMIVYYIISYVKSDFTP